MSNLFPTQGLSWDLHSKSKELGKAVKENCKAAKRCKEALETEQQELEKGKQKYQRSYQEWQDAQQVGSRFHCHDSHMSRRVSFLWCNGVFRTLSELTGTGHCHGTRS